MSAISYTYSSNTQKLFIFLAASVKTQLCDTEASASRESLCDCICTVVSDLLRSSHSSLSALLPLFQLCSHCKYLLGTSLTFNFDFCPCFGVHSKAESEPCALTFVERMTHICLWIKALNHTAEAIEVVLESVMKYFGTHKNEVFKTITGDNGSEFANLSLLEDGKFKLYFTHLYSSW